MGLQNIQIKDIKITENHRVNIGSTHLDELMQSIKQHGVMQPIGVAKDGKDKYILRFGQRRILACEKLGYKVIPAIVEDSITEEKLLLENLTENLQRDAPAFSEMGRIVDKLRKMGLSSKEIAARLGVPGNKIKEILNVYDVLPEKYKKKVVFVQAGRTRKKGTVPALVANKLVIMKKQHGLKNEQLDELFKATEEEGLDRKDLNSVGELIGSGMSVEKALDNMREYGIYSVDVVVKHRDVNSLMAKYGIINRQHLFKKVFYGDLPPLERPDFVFTGIMNYKEAEKIEIDRGPYKKMFHELLEFNLTLNQQAAFLTLKNTSPEEWTKAQCDQIKEIYKRVKAE